MICGTACYDMDLVNALDIFFCCREMLDIDVIVLDPRAYRSLKHLRFLEHLLHHEVSIAALLSSIRIPIDFGNLVVYRLTVDILDLKGILGHNEDAVILHEDYVTCIFDKCRNV